MAYKSSGLRASLRIVSLSFQPPVWSHYPYISVLGQLEQSTTNWVAKTTETSCLSVLQGQVQNHRVARATLPLSPAGEDASFPLLLLASASCPHVLACRCVTPFSASIVTWPSSPCVSLSLHGLFFSLCCPPLIRTQILLESRPTFVQHDIILTSLMTIFPKRVTF